MLGLIWVAVAGAVGRRRPEFGDSQHGRGQPRVPRARWRALLAAVRHLDGGEHRLRRDDVPQINQRFFVARSEKVLKRTLALWPVLVVLLFVPAFMLGAWACGLGVTVPENGNVIPAILNEYTAGWFTAAVIAAAMAAMMSSSDSMLLSGPSYLTRDIYRPLTGASATGEAGGREAFVARVGVVVFATLSFVASLYAPGTLVQIGDTAFGGFAQQRSPSSSRSTGPGRRAGEYTPVSASPSCSTSRASSSGSSPGATSAAGRPPSSACSSVCC